MRLAEIDRRQNHISQVDPNHPLLPVALDCLKDEDVERPSAQQLCERVASLKERAEYSDSAAAAQQERQQLRQQPQQKEIEEKERQLEQLREQLQQLQQRSAREREEKGKQLQQFRELQQSSIKEREEAERLQKQIRQQLQQLQQNLAEENERQLEQLLAAHREEIEQITRAKDEREKQLLENSKQERTRFEKQLHELEEQLLAWRDQAKEPQCVEAAGDREAKRESIKLRWREGRSALFASERWSDAVVDGNRVYIFDTNSQLWTYDVNEKCWLQLSKAPYDCSGFIILDSLPTTIGGVDTNKLMSLTVEGKWIEKYPPMPTVKTFCRCSVH